MWFHHVAHNLDVIRVDNHLVSITLHQPKGCLVMVLHVPLHAGCRITIMYAFDLTRINQDQMPISQRSGGESSCDDELFSLPFSFEVQSLLTKHKRLCTCRI